MVERSESDVLETSDLDDLGADSGENPSIGGEMLARARGDCLEDNDLDDIDANSGGNEGVEEVHLDDGEMARLEEGYDPADALLTGGDIDASTDDAETVGDEAVGGTVATPDQSVVDDLGAAVGLELHDKEWLHTEEVLDTRDDRRWELDPKSSEDYGERGE
jgi:hypothetical protein